MLHPRFRRPALAFRAQEIARLWRFARLATVDLTQSCATVALVVLEIEYSQKKTGEDRLHSNHQQDHRGDHEPQTFGIRKHSKADLLPFQNRLDHETEPAERQQDPGDYAPFE